MDARIIGNSAFDLNLLSRSDVFLLDDLLNQGSGDVNVLQDGTRQRPGLIPLVKRCRPTPDRLDTANTGVAM